MPLSLPFAVTVSSIIALAACAPKEDNPQSTSPAPQQTSEAPPANIYEPVLGAATAQSENEFGFQEATLTGNHEFIYVPEGSFPMGSDEGESPEINLARE